MSSDEVKAARETLGLTQKQLAAALHLESKFSRDTVRFWEKGARTVPGPPGVAIRLMLELHKLTGGARSWK
jgi:DNA-binding transcriptional regulator YiaG